MKLTQLKLCLYSYFPQILNAWQTLMSFAFYYHRHSLNGAEGIPAFSIEPKNEQWKFEQETAVSHFHLLNCSNAHLLCWPSVNRSRRVPFPFCQIMLKAQKPLKDWYTKSFYRQQLKNIGLYLRNKRLEAGISQEKMAKNLNTSVVSIRSWEHARTIPNIRYLPKLIEFLGYDPLETGKKTD